ncbi:MAG: AAA family ATPase [Bacteroidota bacterium]
MEKRFDKNCQRIVITGPECTGKSWLSYQLARKTRQLWLPEYARYYIYYLNRDYSRKDVEHIAQMQIELEEGMAAVTPRVLFLDTGLIITKVWLEHVYGNSPSWLDEAIKNSHRYMHLLCYPDLPWHPDPLRENKDLRMYFFNWYEQEIRNYGFDYQIIKGDGDARLQSALKVVRKIV